MPPEKKATTFAVIPLGTTEAFDESAEVWNSLQTIVDSAQVIVAIINTADEEPLLEHRAVSLPPLWTEVKSQPDQSEIAALHQVFFKGLMMANCYSLKRQGIKYIVFVARDDDVEAVARSATEQLNKNMEQPWATVYRPAVSLAASGGIVETILNFLKEFLLGQ
jgi:hypothetical protein